MRSEQSISWRWSPLPLSCFGCSLQAGPSLAVFFRSKEPGSSAIVGSHTFLSHLLQPEENRWKNKIVFLNWIVDTFFVVAHSACEALSHISLLRKLATPFAPTCLFLPLFASATNDRPPIAILRFPSSAPPFSPTSNGRV